MNKLVVSLTTISLLFSCVSDGEKQSEAMSVVKNWIGYHNKHDYAKLMAITADTINYYGEKLTPNELILRLTKARQEKTQDYQQILGNLILDSGNVDEGLLQFNFINRTVGANDRAVQDVPTKIVVSSGKDGKWKLRQIDFFHGYQSNVALSEDTNKQKLDTSEKITLPDVDKTTSSITTQEPLKVDGDLDESEIIEAQEALRQSKQSKGDRTSDEVNKSKKLTNSINYNLSGFGISSAPRIKNNSQDHGSVSIEVCLDKQGKIKSLRKTGGTSTSLYLKDLSINAVKQFEFFPIGSQEETNCGTITFNYALN